MKRAKLSAIPLIILITISLFSAIYTEVILWINDGYLPKHTFFIVGQVVLAMIAIYFIRGHFRLPNIIFFSYAVMIMYLILDIGYLYMVSNVGIHYTLSNLMVYWFYIVIIPVYFYADSLNVSKIMTRYLVFMFLVSAVIGVCQYAFNDPVWILKSSNSTFNMYAAYFHGKLRALGLFLWPISFGYYLIFMFSLFLLYFKYTKSMVRYIFLFMMIASVMLTYMTLTRAAYIGLIFSCASTFLFYYRRLILLRMMPVLYLVITAVIIASSGYIHAALHGSTIVSDGSVIQRLNQWGCVFHMITKNSGNLFFGTGMTQGLTSFNGATLLIDNSFLAITLQTGIFGLFAYVLISYMLYLHMLNGIITLSPESSGNAEEILKMATASFYSTWLALAFINLNFIFPYVIFMIYKMCGIKKMKKKLSPVDICSYS